MAETIKKTKEFTNKEQEIHKAEGNKRWTTFDELAFIRSLPITALQRYKQGIKFRTNWGMISKSRIYMYIGLPLL